MKNPVKCDKPIAPLLGDRWSPRAFSERALSNEECKSLLEAARWAPSCFNEQPWRLLVTRSGGDGHETLLGTLAPANQSWAKRAPLLILAVAKRSFERNGNPNRWASHDLGMATQNLLLQAESMGLAGHAMGGFDEVAAREGFGIGDDFDVLSVIAIGEPADASVLPSELAEREKAPRARRDAAELFFEGQWPL